MAVGLIGAGQTTDWLAPLHTAHTMVEQRHNAGSETVQRHQCWINAGPASQVLAQHRGSVMAGDHSLRRLHHILSASATRAVRDPLQHGTYIRIFIRSSSMRGLHSRGGPHQSEVGKVPCPSWKSNSHCICHSRSNATKQARDNETMSA